MCQDAIILEVKGNIVEHLEYVANEYLGKKLTYNQKIGFKG